VYEDPNERFWLILPPETPLLREVTSRKMHGDTPLHDGTSFGDESSFELPTLRSRHTHSSLAELIRQLAHPLGMPFPQWRELEKEDT
jgi:hypothetical protein